MELGTSILFLPNRLKPSKLDRAASVLTRGLNWPGERGDTGDMGDKVAFTVSGSFPVYNLLVRCLLDALDGPPEADFEP